LTTTSTEGAAAAGTLPALAPAAPDALFAFRFGFELEIRFSEELEGLMQQRAASVLKTMSGPRLLL